MGGFSRKELQKSEREKPHSGKTKSQSPTKTPCNQPAIARKYIEDVSGSNGYTWLHGESAFPFPRLPPIPSSEVGRAPWAVYRPLLMMGPPGGGELRIPAQARGVCGVARLSPPALRSGLRWLRGSGDHPIG